MESRRLLPIHFTKHLILICLFLLYLEQVRADVERNRRSNQLKGTLDGVKNNNHPLNADDRTFQNLLSEECTNHFQNWMNNVTTTINRENATLVVDWSELDKILMARNCPYDQLWIELWKVKENKLPPNDKNHNGDVGNQNKDIFGTPEYFLENDRCTQLNENFFEYHSTHAHDRRAKNNKNDGVNGMAEEEDVDENNHIVSLSPNDLVAVERLHSAYSTRTTFLHVVERSYILRLCPCGTVRKSKRVCDCEYTSALCSGVIKIQQPPELKVYRWCNTDSTNEPISTEDGELFTMNSPITSCNSVVLAGSLRPCTPVQDYDRVKVILHPTITDLIECDPHHDFGHDHDNHEEPSTAAVVRVSDLVESRDGKSKGDFSVDVSNLKDNSTFCVQVELVDHPYCNSHITIGDPLRQPIVCDNKVAQPVKLPSCNKGPMIINEDSGIPNKIVVGTLAGIFGILATVCIFTIYIRCKNKKQREGAESTNHEPPKSYSNPTSIIKSGAIIPNSQTTSCTNTLLSKISMAIPDVFFLNFPDTKHFEEINAIFRDWLTSLGNHVYDLSDSQYDEPISKDPESWVMKILMKPNIKIVVIDSPVARFSLALASSSTATTSLVSSTASVDSIEHIEEEDMNDMEKSNTKEMEVEDEEAEIRVPLSQKPLVSRKNNTLECNVAAAAENHQLPECAMEDNRYELRVFAMKMIQSRFIGKYKQIIVLRYENGLPLTKTNQTKAQAHLPPSSHRTFKKEASSSETSQLLNDTGGTGNIVFHQQEIARKLTPHKQCLVLPQHMPELRSWLRGHGDLYCGNDGLSDFIETGTLLSPSMAEELPYDEYHKINGNHVLPQFHRHRLTSTSSSQAYTASTSSHPSSPLLTSSALENKLRSSLSTSSSSSTSSSASANPNNKSYSKRKKSTSSATTTSIV